MALIIENGSIVAGAESYTTAAIMRAYASKRGATVPADDAACEALLIKACDYLQAQEMRFKGGRVSPLQTLAWPRLDVSINGFYISSTSIPAEVINAQIELAIQAQTIDLLPTIDAAKQTGPIIEKTIDVLTTKFAEPTKVLVTSTFAKAEGLLAKLFKYGANQVPVVRT